MSDAAAIEIDDLVVILLGAPVAHAPEGEVQGITRLEKLIFLIERETSSKDWLTEDAKFEPYNFGPFSEKVYQAVGVLAAAGMITDSSSVSLDQTDSWEEREGIELGSGPIGSAEDPYTTRDFRLTDRGWRYYKALIDELPKGAIEEIEEFKRRFAFLPLRQLVRYVYTRYDDYTTKSHIRNEILGQERPA